LNISKKEEKKHRMSSAGKKIVDSLTFLLFKEKKMFSSTPIPSSTNFSLFLKNGKNAKINILFKKMHVLSKKTKAKIN